MFYWVLLGCTGFSNKLETGCFTEFYWVLLCFIGFLRVLLVFTGLHWGFIKYLWVYWVLLGCTAFSNKLETGCYRVLLGFLGSAELHQILLGFTGLYWVQQQAWNWVFYRVLLGSTVFYWVLTCFTGFYWVTLGFYQVSLGLLGFTGLYCVQQQAWNWVLPSFTGFSRFCWASPDFTGFYWVVLGSAWNWVFYRVLPGFLGSTELYRILNGFFIWFIWKKNGKTKATS